MFSHFKSKQVLTAILLIFTAIQLTSCTNRNEVNQTLYAFGTEVHLQMLVNNKEQANKAIHEIEQHFIDFNQDWHAWQQGSTLFKINQAINNQKPISVADDIKQFIIKSQQLSQESNGLFDPAIGQLVSLWGFHSEDWGGQPPKKSTIQQYLNNRASISQIHFDGNQLRSSNPEVQLDFGGNVKGLALKQAAQIFKANGIEHGIINIGGDMLVLGNKNGQAWQIGVQDPKQPQQIIAQVQASDGMAVVTSGTYQRFFEWQGKSYSHILNPNTGYPADTFASVTIVHPDATRADAAATAILIAGKNDWQKVAQKMQIEKVFAIDHFRKVYITEAMQPFLKTEIPAN